MDMTAATMVAASLASPGHYARMIDRSFTEIGVAIDVAPDGTVFMTQDFGQP